MLKNVAFEPKSEGCNDTSLNIYLQTISTKFVLLSKTRGNEFYATNSAFRVSIAN